MGIGLCWVGGIELGIGEGWKIGMSSWALEAEDVVLLEAYW